MKKFYISLLPVLLFICAGNFSANATPDTIKTGSFIIDMGVVPQTIANGLKPYGLVYALIKDHRVPVRWVINNAKTKDGIDFTHNGVSYRGGTFIITFEFRTPAVNAVISAWQAQGVVGNTTVSTFVLNITKTFYFAPNWTLDKQNGIIATSYFTNAGIPSSAYGGSSANWKDPSQLNACDDIFVMPHADPTWTTHNNLYYWNMNHKGNLWAACHAVSELENISDPLGIIKLNFLSTNGLVHWTNHQTDATPPYLYEDHGHPIMQFMQIMDEATAKGSEQIYLPKLMSAWRSTTTVGVHDNSNADIPFSSLGPAAVVAYGRGFGDLNRGYVMYQGGHDHDNGNATEAERVAAQRAFFNYSFFVAIDRYAAIGTSISGLPEVIVGYETYTLSFEVPAEIDLNNYTVNWSSSGGGTFTSTGNKQSIYFTAPASQVPTIVSVTITDGCGREVFLSKGSFIGSVLPVSVRLQGDYQPANGSVQLNWTETNNQSVSHYEIQRADNSSGFKTISRFFPENNGDKVNYSYTDKNTPAGSIKYRLQVYNKAKTSLYSNTIKIATGTSGTAHVTLIGNPVRSTVTFEYRSPVTETITAAILDMNGGMVSSKKFIAQKGTSIVQIENLSHQPAGTYLLRVLAGGKTVVSKINLVK